MRSKSVNRLKSYIYVLEFVILRLVVFRLPTTKYCQRLKISQLHSPIEYHSNSDVLTALLFLFLQTKISSEDTKLCELSIAVGSLRLVVAGSVHH